MNSSEVGIKIVIDAKEGRQELTLTESDILKLVKQTETLKATLGSTFVLGPAAGQLKAELLSVGAATTEVSEAVAEFIKYNGLSEQEVKQVISALQQEKSALGITTAEFTAHQNALESLNGGYQKLKSQHTQFPQDAQKVQQGTSSMNMAMNQLGYILNDSQVFLLDFRMGLMGISNNLPMFVSMLKTASDEAKLMGQTVGQALVSSLAGPGGLVLAINGVMLLLNILPGLFSKATEKVKDQADEIKKLRDEYKNLSMAQISNAKQQLYNDLAKDVSGTGAKGKILIGAGGFDFMGEGNEKVNELLDQANAKFRALNESSTALGITLSNMLLKNNLQPIYTYRKEMGESIQSLKDQAEILKREFDNATSDSQRGFLNSKIKSIEAEIKAKSKDPKAEKTNYDQLGTEAKKAAELKGELSQVLILKKEYLTQSQKEIQLTEAEYNSKIQGLKDEMARLQQDPKKTSSDRAKIQNLATEISVNEAKKEYEIEQLRKKVLMETYDQKVKQYEIDKGLNGLHGQSSTYITAQMINELELLKSQAKTAEERLHIELKLRELRSGQFGEMGEKGAPFGFQGGKSPLDYKDEEEQLTQALWNEKEKRINIVQDTTQQMANAFSTMYQYMWELGSKDAKEWESKELKKLAQQEKAALKSARSERDKERITEEYQRKKDAVEEQAQKKAQDKAKSWFEFQKWANFALTITSTYKAATAALEPSPVGLGPLLGIPLAAATVAAGLANAAVISQQKMPGFEKGGIVVGEKGPEVIVPMQDYARGW
ncbi:MAG: hypothetical protein ACM3UR_13265, partial [Bacteroidota bacterium]